MDLIVDENFKKVWFELPFYLKRPTSTMRIVKPSCKGQGLFSINRVSTRKGLIVKFRKLKIHAG